MHERAACHPADNACGYLCMGLNACWKPECLYTRCCSRSGPCHYQQSDLLQVTRTFLVYVC